LAAAQAVLEKRQRELGVVLVDLGAGTSSLAIYEEMRLLHTAVLPLGSSHVTNDVAIGLRTSIEVAEEIKRTFGTALPETVKDSESIVIEGDKSATAGEQESVSRKEVANIIRARLDEILSFVDRELKGIGRSGLLPGGVLFTGGGAHLPGLVDVAKKKLRLPARVGTPRAFEGSLEPASDPGYAVVLGLILWALSQEQPGRRLSLAIPDMRATVGKVRGWFKSFLP
jgi:cell division protein FtsA